MTDAEQIDAIVRARILKRDDVRETIEIVRHMLASNEGDVLRDGVILLQKFSPWLREVILAEPKQNHARPDGVTLQ